jgi:hypothetical protein
MNFFPDNGGEDISGNLLGDSLAGSRRFIRRIFLIFVELFSSAALIFLPHHYNAFQMTIIIRSPTDSSFLLMLAQRTVRILHKPLSHALLVEEMVAFEG